MFKSKIKLLLEDIPELNDKVTRKEEMQTGFNILPTENASWVTRGIKF